MAEEKRGPGRPKKEGGPDKTRSLRIGPAWDEAIKISAWRGDSLNAIITSTLEMYNDLHRREYQAAQAEDSKES